MAIGAHKDGAPTERVSLGEVSVDPARPLEEYRSGASMAYHADGGDPAKGESFAVVCDPAALPRIDLMTTLRKVEAASLVLPRASRVVDWVPTGRRHVVIAFDKPAGGRLTRSLEQPVAPLGEDDAFKNFLVPVVAGLRQLHAAGIVHGSVNPTNMFFHDAARRQLMLGECVCAARAALQPTSCLPIELAMSAPYARGEGQVADDLFGLGVSLAYLLLGRDPTRGIDEDMLLWGRIDFGSYGAIIGNQRILPPFSDLLRGLLADDPRVRWTVPEVENFIAARTTVTRQGAVAKRASRPFEFYGRGFFTARAVAHAFAGDPTTAAEAIRTKDFDGWMQRALGDETSANLLKLARNEAPGEERSEMRDANLVARVGIALDLQAPIRYRDVSSTVDGLGGALAVAFLTRRPTQSIAEAVLQGIPQFLLTAKVPPSPDQLQLFKLYEQLRYQLNDRRPGFGIERLLYELHPTVHCLAPLIERDCVVSITGLLPALERQAVGDFGGSFPIERHCAAFVAARFKSGTGEWVDDLAARDPATRVIGALRMLARLQAQGGPKSLPALAKWAAGQAMSLIEGYHHRPTRKYLKGLLDHAVKAGSLADLLAVIDNSDREKRDEDGFVEASRAYAAVAAELQRGADAATRQPRQIDELAGQLAAGLASCAAAAGLIAAAVLLG